MNTPNPSFKDAALRALLAFLGVGAVLFGFWWIRQTAMGTHPRAPLSERERVQELLRNDLSSLNKSDVTEAELFGAIVRLGERGDAHARQEAVRRSTGDSVMLRRAAAEALGYFDDPESLAVLRKLLEDKDPTVRTQALQGLTHKLTPERLQILRQFAERPGLSGDEKMALYSALIQESPTSEAKEAAVQELIKLAESADANLSLRAALNVVSLAPHDPKVVEMLERLLQAGKDPRIEGVAIRHLAVLQNSWLRKNSKKFLESTDSQTRMAAVQSVHLLCPVDRWAVLENVMKTERDRTVLAASIQEVVLMPGPDAQALLERMIQSEVLKGSEAILAKNALVDLKKSPGVDQCLAYKEKSG